MNTKFKLNEEENYYEKYKTFDATEIMKVNIFNYFFNYIYIKNI